MMAHNEGHAPTDEPKMLQKTDQQQKKKVQKISLNKLTQPHRVLLSRNPRVSMIAIICAGRSISSFRDLQAGSLARELFQHLANWWRGQFHPTRKKTSS
jgi:hypothetical protein